MKILVQTDEEHKAKERVRMKKHREKPENKAKEKEYEEKPEVKKRKKEHREKPENKAKEKVYRENPINKAKKKIRDQSPKTKARNKKHNAKPEVKKRKKAYTSRPDIKAGEKTRQQTPEYKTHTKTRVDDLRLRVFKYFSKLYSNSDIPCCRCCGENSDMDFLAIDHIMGKYKMDSIKELTDLDYSSKLIGQPLNTWLVKHNFLSNLKIEYFQVLCHNCNFAKGMPRNNNTCPHEIMRKEETFAMMEEQSSFEV